MNDFLKIFLVLCAVVSAFFFGRNFGEETRNESTEIKTLKSENFQNQNAQIELRNLKDKFQKLLDSSDLKKADEVLGKIMTIFLADLSLQISDSQQHDFDEGKKLCLSSINNNTVEKNKDKSLHDEEIKKEPEIKKNTIRNIAKFKSAETEILNTEDPILIKELLQQLELKKIDSLLEGAPSATFQQSRKFLGTYRGSVIDVTGKTYGTLVMELESTPEETSPLKGNVRVFQNGVQTSNNNFTSSGFGYTPNDYKSTVFQLGASGYLQLYKIEPAQKIAGLYYERLPNGTSKTIGTFVLSRTDFID